MGTLERGPERELGLEPVPGSNLLRDRGQWHAQRTMPQPDAPQVVEPDSYNHAEEPPAGPQPWPRKPKPSGGEKTTHLRTTVDTSPEHCFVKLLSLQSSDARSTRFSQIF